MLSKYCTRSIQSGHTRLSTRAILVAVFVAVSPTLYGCAGATHPQTTGPESQGTIELNQSPSDVLQGGGGTGTVFYNGKLYRFAIGGLGVGGDAIAVLQASGEVYNLTDIAQFQGIYRAAPSNSAGSSRVDTGGLWLQNERAALLHLKTPSGGRMPSIGSDAVKIVME